jgi:hypothetical protein
MEKNEYFYYIGGGIFTLICIIVALAALMRIKKSVQGGEVDDGRSGDENNPGDFNF